MDLNAALQTLHSGQTISLTFITADISRGSGGRIIHLPRTRIARKKPINEPASEIKTEFTGIKRNPHHNLHFTRNVELPDKSLRKVHPLLILNINNTDVI